MEAIYVCVSAKQKVLCRDKVRVSFGMLDTAQLHSARELDTDTSATVVPTVTN